MSKIIKSPVKYFPGEVVLSNPLNYPQVIAWEDAMIVTGEAGKDISIAHAHQLLLPAVLACVQEWRLDKFPTSPTVDTFPATPRAPCAELVSWLITEITALFREAEEIPNE